MTNPHLDDPWTVERDADLRARYLAGEPWKDLCARYDRSLDILAKRVRRLGCPRRTPYSTPRAERGGYMTPWLSQRDKLIALASEGLDDHEIATRLARSRDGVRHERRRIGIPTDAELVMRAVEMLIENGVKTHSALALTDRILRRFYMNDEFASTVRELNDLNIKNSVVAERLGVPEEIVKRIRREFGIPRGTLITCVTCGKSVRVRIFGTRYCSKHRKSERRRMSRVQTASEMA